MKKIEKYALLQYIEFHLIKLCESTEKNIDPDAVGTLYGNAYDILNDLDDVIETTDTQTQKYKPKR